MNLTVEEKTLLNNSLLTLPSGYESVRFWGKIQGESADYLVVVAQNKLEEEDDYPDQTFFFCDNVSFRLKKLGSPVRHVDVDRKTPLTGNPKEELVPAVEGTPANEEEGIEESPEVPAYTEADLLALIVNEIAYSTNIVPKGAFIADPCHRVVRNVNYGGLSFAEATDLNSYFHFRKPEDPLRCRNVDGLIKPNDFLDNITTTHPTGAWSVQSDPCKTVITIRSLLFPGYEFSLNIENGSFTSTYFGNGLKNEDLAFML